MHIIMWEQLVNSEGRVYNTQPALKLSREGEAYISDSQKPKTVQKPGVGLPKAVYVDI